MQLCAGSGMEVREARQLKDRAEEALDFVGTFDSRSGEANWMIDDRDCLTTFDGMTIKVHGTRLTVAESSHKMQAVPRTDFAMRLRGSLEGRPHAVSNSENGGEDFSKFYFQVAAVLWLIGPSGTGRTSQWRREPLDAVRRHCCGSSAPGRDSLWMGSYCKPPRISPLQAAAFHSVRAMPGIRDQERKLKGLNEIGIAHLFLHSHVYNFIVPGQPSPTDFGLRGSTVCLSSASRLAYSLAPP